MKDPLFLGLCALFAGVMALIWGLLLAVFHPEAGLALGMVIFILGFYLLVYNDKERQARKAMTHTQGFTNTMWLYNPESPGAKVLVVRGFWGRMCKPKDFATLDETLHYSAFMAELQRRRFDD